MKIGSIILTILSFLAIPLFIFLPYMVNMATEQDKIMGIVLAVVAFALLGYIAHILISRYREENGGGTFIYVITFPAFILPFVVIFIVWAILCVLNQILYVFFDRYVISDFLDFVKEKMLFTGGRRQTASAGGGNPTYSVYSQGCKRTLTFVRGYITDMQLENQPHYDRYIDDIGYYWRTYDGGKSFISEADLLRERGSLL